jgi:Fe-S-cluster containining protein
MAEASFIPLGSLHDRASDWFAHAHAAVLGAVPCRRGCSRCCIGPFAITILDARLLRRGLTTVSAEVREDIEARANSQVQALERAFPRLADSPFLDDWTDEDQDAVAARFADLPCPALDAQGSCRVYETRPLTCRTMGIPIELNGAVQGACDVQTAVPIVRLPPVFREEEDRLAEEESRALAVMERSENVGDELWLPYGFLPQRV